MQYRRRSGGSQYFTSLRKICLPLFRSDLFVSHLRRNWGGVLFSFSEAFLWIGIILFGKEGGV